ncbi:MAG: hypothetical protein U0930_00035 [Pirellulales bacterium]
MKPLFKSIRATHALLLSACIFLVACDSSQSSVAQQPPLNRQAQGLLVAAAEAFNEADYKTTLAKCKEVAELLPEDARVQQRAAELLYLAGHAKESVSLFDKANQLDEKRAPHNWQRGIALATVGDFKRGAEQFKIHHEVNPDDVENSAWYYLCVAKSENVEAAKKTLIGSRGDKREPMMDILQMLRGEGSPEKVIAAAEKVGPAPENKKMAQFYGDLYIGLYYDSIGRTENAEKFLKRSLSYEINGYMADTARVYLAERFQKSKDAESNGKP